MGDKIALNPSEEAHHRGDFSAGPAPALVAALVRVQERGSVPRFEKS